MKDNKLVRFFNAIKFNIDFTSFFEEATLKDVLLDKKKNKMTMIIEMDNLIPLDVFKELCEKSKVLDGAEKVHFKFIIKNNDKLFLDYFNFYFDILVSKCPMLECIDRENISIENNKINIDVLNKAEKSLYF